MREKRAEIPGPRMPGGGAEGAGAHVPLGFRADG